MNLLSKRKTRTELLFKSLNEDKELNKRVNLKVNIKPITNEEIVLEKIPSNNKDILYSNLNSEIKVKPDQQKRSLFGKLFFNKTAKIACKPTENNDFDKVGIGGKKIKKHKRTKHNIKRQRNINQEKIKQNAEVVFKHFTPFLIQNAQI